MNNKNTTMLNKTKNQLTTRKNNIELKNEKEFVYWYPNEDYGKMNELLAPGATMENDCIVTYYNGVKFSKHKSCFESPENCYVIAFLDTIKEDGEYQLRTVGNRLIDLKSTDFKDFMSLYRDFVKLKKVN